MRLRLEHDEATVRRHVGTDGVADARLPDQPVVWQPRVGPVAVTAIMTYAVLSPLAAPGSPQYLVLAAALALFSGVMLLAGGAMRLGFLAQLLSRPVISGFIAGSAILIVISQIKYLFGVSPGRGSTGQVLADVLRLLPHSHAPTLAIGVSALALLVFV